MPIGVYLEHQNRFCKQNYMNVGAILCKDSENVIKINDSSFFLVDVVDYDIIVLGTVG